jgi:DNA-binding response OmpR family regulator
MKESARICVIDDEVDMLDAVALGLTEAGYDVAVAPGAAAGLDLIARTGVDAIVTDMNMAGTSGAQLIAQARAAWPHMPIVAMSGSICADGSSMLDAALDLGADALLQKPFRIAELNAVLDQVLRSRRGSK